MRPVAIGGGVPHARRRPEEVPVRQIDPSNVLAYVMEHTDATREQAEACLAIQAEYMVAVGIMYSPVGEEWPFQYYSEAEREALPGRGRVVDTLALARDCVRLAGVPEEVAHAVYAAETEFVA